MQPRTSYSNASCIVSAVWCEECCPRVSQRGHAHGEYVPREKIHTGSTVVASSFCAMSTTNNSLMHSLSKTHWRTTRHSARLSYLYAARPCVDVGRPARFIRVLTPDVLSYCGEWPQRSYTISHPLENCKENAQLCTRRYRKKYSTAERHSVLYLVAL